MNFTYQQVLRYAAEMWMAILANQTTVHHVDIYSVQEYVWQREYKMY